MDSLKTRDGRVMAMSNVYELCFYGGLSLAIVFLIVSVVLFFVLRIPKVFGELTGRAAKKGIREKQQGKASGAKDSKKQKDYYNQGSGKITARDTVSQETKKANKDDTTDNLNKETENQESSVTPQFDPNETAVLGASPEMDREIEEAANEMLATEILNTNKRKSVTTEILGAEKTSAKEPIGDDTPTDVLKAEEDDEVATDVLSAEEDDEAATDVLSAEEDDEAATDVLRTEEDDEAATDVLKAEEDDEAPTDVLRADGDVDSSNEEVVVDNEESTTVLTSKKTLRLASKVKVIYNVVIVNTNENI